jgi:hypothetical protein
MRRPNSSEETAHKRAVPNFVLVSARTPLNLNELIPQLGFPTFEVPIVSLRVKTGHVFAG